MTGEEGSQRVIDRQETIDRFTEEHERLKELVTSLPETQVHAESTR